MTERAIYTFHPAPPGWRAGRVHPKEGRPDDIRHVIGWLITIKPPIDQWGEHDPYKDPHVFALAVVDNAGAGTEFSADYWLAPGEEPEDD